MQTGGETRLTPGRQLQIQGRFDIQAGYLLANNGTITVSDGLWNAGTIYFPEAAYATLVVNGSYHAVAGGSINIRIGGEHLFDSVQISGAADVSGNTLVVALVNGYEPPIGLSWRIFTCNPGDGAFDEILAPGLSTFYDPSDLYLDIVS